MKNIILLILLITSLLQSDTVGLVGKVWNSVPTEIYNETETLSNIQTPTVENEIQEDIASNGWLEDTTESTVVANEVIIPTNTLPDAEILIGSIQNEIVIPTQDVTTPVVDSQIVEAISESIQEEVVEEPILSGKAEIVENSLNIKQQTEKVLNFINPLWLFAQENKLLSGLFLTTLGVLFYLLFHSPSSSRIEDEHGFDDEFEIPQAIMPRATIDSSNSMLLDKSSIISQSQYSTLYGLINETFISEKERVMLASDITQERKNRALISLEWKFNQILHFSLPKLSSNNSYHFTEGVTELLDEDLTKDILVIALKDILKLKSIKEEDKMQIVKKLKNLELKKEFA